MTKKIRIVGSTQKRIHDTSPTQPPVDPAVIAAALGAEPTGVKIESGSPLSRIGVGREVSKRLAGTTSQPRRITLTPDQWKQLDDLAIALTSPGVTPSSGQVATALLNLSLRTLADPSADRTALAQELATLAPQANGPATDEKSTETTS